MQAFSGLAESGVGAYATLGTGGLAAPVGWPVFVHGLDQLITGLTTAFSGEYRDTLTSQLLQTTGISAQTADMIDSGISIVGSMGSIAVIRAHQLAAFPVFKLPSKPIINLGEEFQETKNVIRLWPSPTKSPQVINGIEYVPHAMERMSPRGLIHTGTEMVSRAEAKCNSNTHLPQVGFSITFCFSLISLKSRRSLFRHTVFLDNYLFDRRVGRDLIHRF